MPRSEPSDHPLLELRALVRDMHVVDDSFECYALTPYAIHDGGQVCWNTISEGAGWTDSRPLREILQARLMIPSQMANI
jgi:hypothetical protein